MNKQAVDVTVVYNIDELLHNLNRKKVAETGKRSSAVPVTALVDEVGYSRPTITSMIDSQDRPELQALTAWLRFFRRNGMNVTAADLFRTIDAEAEAA